MSIILTESAAKRIQILLTKRGHGIGLRLGVKTTGCSGLAYTTELVDTTNPDDVEFESCEIKVFVDKKSLSYIDGTIVDYVRDGLQECFKFKNPNVKDECGCGESFTV